MIVRSEPAKLDTDSPEIDDDGLPAGRGNSTGPLSLIGVLFRTAVVGPGPTTTDGVPETGFAVLLNSAPLLPDLARVVLAVNTDDEVGGKFGS